FGCTDAAAHPATTMRIPVGRPIGAIVGDGRPATHHVCTVTPRAAEATSMSRTKPSRLDAIVEEFREAPDDLRIDLLLEYAESLPPLPDHLDDADMEQVVECQTPFFLHSEIVDGRVRLWFS